MLGSYNRCRILSVELDAFTLLTFCPSSDNEYEYSLGRSLSHDSYLVTEATLDTDIKRDAPRVALHEEKEREEKERVEIESAPPPSIYNAPPLSVAEHDSNEREERDSLCSEVRVAEIAPPFVDEQFVNVTPERVTSVGIEVNSNTPPFPDSLLIHEN